MSFDQDGPMLAAGEAVTASTATMSVDSALLAALRDQRERVALLRLENVLIDFIKTDGGWLEVGGPYNSIILKPSTEAAALRQLLQQTGRQTSFHRCILHRLADRFQIVRETGSLMEGSIRLIKLPESKIPSQLLQDLEASDYNPAASATESVTKSLQSISLVDGTNSGSSKPRKSKMKLMKRSPSAASTGSGSSTPRSRSASSNGQLKNSPFSDKEKAYAEARARIFSDEQQNSQGSTSGVEATTATADFNNGNGAAVTTSDTRTSSDDMHKEASSSSLASSTDADGNRKKAVYRNRAEEAADPDFQRGAAAVVFQQPYGYEAYGGGYTQQYPYMAGYAVDETASPSRAPQQAQQQQAAYYTSATQPQLQGVWQQGRSQSSDALSNQEGQS